MTLNKNTNAGKRVILVGVVTTPWERAEIDEHLQELGLLAGTLGYQIMESQVVQRKKIKPATYIGRGKIAELKEMIALADIDEAIFDNDLSPSQTRNLQKGLDVRVRDRSGIILDIFARHARTRAAKTQIELATLEYLLPRLTRRWTHLERQIGGIGVRGGGGETQIEIDRRLIRDRITQLKSELAKIKKRHAVQSKHRDQEYKVALVGYTNAGKSTLMQALTNTKTVVKDELFATLDTTIRKCCLDKNHRVLLSDTVGFIRKLPPNLVASFRTTLKEVENADLIIKVSDISSPHCFKQLQTVNKVLKDLGAIHTPEILVFNKIDQLDQRIFKQAQQDYPQAIFLSALKHLRIDQLRASIRHELKNEETQVRVKIPSHDIDGLVTLRDNTNILRENWDADAAEIELVSYKRVWNHVRKHLSGDAQVETLR